MDEEEDPPKRRHKSKSPKKHRSKTRSPPSPRSDDSDESEEEEEEPRHKRKHKRNAEYPPNQQQQQQQQQYGGYPPSQYGGYPPSGGYPPQQGQYPQQYGAPPQGYPQPYPQPSMYGPPPPPPPPPPPAPVLPASLFIPIYPPVAGVLPGLEPLHASTGIGIRFDQPPFFFKSPQELNKLELVLPVEMDNRYSVLNYLNQRIYFMAENSYGCERYCYGQNRQFRVIVYNGVGKEILFLERKRTWSLACWGGKVAGSLVEVTYAPTGDLIGVVKQGCGPVIPHYRITDPDDKTLLRIRGEAGTKCLARCSTVSFQVMDVNDTMVSKITRTFKFVDYVTDSADTFGMMFSEGMDSRLKAILMGAVICIDFNFFEDYKGMSITSWGCAKKMCSIICGIIVIGVFVAIGFAVKDWADKRTDEFGKSNVGGNDFD